MNPHLTSDESRVLQVILSDHAYRDAIEHQINGATIKREWTGYAFFTDFDVPAEAPRAPLVGREVLDAYGQIGGEKCGFILFIDDGVATMLECYTYGPTRVPEYAPIEHVSLNPES